MSVLVAITLVCLLGICVAVGANGHSGSAFEAPEDIKSPREYWRKGIRG